MDATNEAIQHWRDVRLWGGIVGAILVAIAGIVALYAQHKISVLEEQKKNEASKKEIALDTLKSVDTVKTPPVRKPRKKRAEKTPTTESPKEEYHVTSHGQTGGVTAGKIENLTIKDESELIDPKDNFICEQEGLTFKVRPKAGKWNQPFFMIPIEEKDSCKFTVSNQSEQGFDLALGVEETSGGRRWHGAVYGFHGPVLNPATKDFWYSITFTTHRPSIFIFGDRSRGLGYSCEESK